MSEPTIQRVGADRILVQLPGLQDPAQLRALLGSTAKMSFHLLGDASSPDGIRNLQDSQGNSYPVRNTVALGGDRLSDASAGFDPQTREPVVNFRFDRTGAREFAAVTQANVGQADRDRGAQRRRRPGQRRQRCRPSTPAFGAPMPRSWTAT